ncbi:MAG TPA: lytic transglycosylase domain-containing protein [Nitrospirota bacterium]
MKSEKTTFAITVAALLFLSPHPAIGAEIYQYTDAQGIIHFSNVSAGNGKKFKVIKSAPAKEQRREPAPRAAAPAAAPISSSNIPSAYLDIINAACGRHGIDPALVHAIVKVESDFNPFALSRKGAMGLMQLMPQTAVDMNVRNTFNPDENIDGGVRYLRYLIDRYEGNLPLALAAYNSGETAVKKWGTVPPFPETQNYVQKILKIYGGEYEYRTPTPRCTIYIGYGDDGALLLTDNPSKHAGKKLKRKTPRNL